MKRRIFLALAAVVALLGCAFVAAQAQPSTPAALGLLCPHVSNPVVGQTVTCTYVGAPVPPTTTTTVPPVTTTTTSTTTAPTTTVPPTTTTTTTTTQPPSGALKGWQVNASTVGLAPHGLSCDKLPLYDGPSRPDRGNTISGVRIDKYIDMSAGDVTLDRVCLRPRNQGVLGSLASTTVGKVVASEERCCFYGLPVDATATIRDSEIDGSLVSAENIATANAFDGAANLYRNHMHDVGSGIAFRETGNQMSFIVENNLVTGLRHAKGTDAHHEAATVRDFVENSSNSRSVTFRGNRFVVEVDAATGGLFLQDTWVRIRNVNVHDNYFTGGGWLLRIDQRHSNGVTGIRATNNRFTPTGWGAATSNAGWAEWRDNHLYDAAKLDGKGTAVRQ